MKTCKTYFLSLIALMAISFQMAGQGGAVMLAYNPPEGKSFAYTLTTAVTQAMEVEGQSVNVFINSNLGYNARLAGKKGENLNYEITVQSLSMNIDAMGNAMSNDVAEVKGKSFSILVAGTGKVLDASEASRIEYTVELR